MKTKKTRISHTDVFGCEFDAVFRKIIRQKQKYPCKSVPNTTVPEIAEKDITLIIPDNQILFIIYFLAAVVASGSVQRTS